jgi:hypothetical protein
MLPLESQFIHVRWSGEAIWIPFGDRRLGLAPENATSYALPGQLLLYPGGDSEMEILLAYGACRFSSKVGQLAGNHFATVSRGAEQVSLVGRDALWNGAQPLTFKLR